ncbi:MAG: hypothetical protein HY579_08915 [Nitrospinae bacterium]|nr:hypothetical protein [Nitrospinota bacterium]
MIRRIVNRGFKDQDRTTELTGLDLFTSDNVNGVGKSAVLEAFKLGLLGEIPGKARTLEDILQFTSLPEMAVEIVAAGDAPGGNAASRLRRGGNESSVTSAKQITVERRFLREAAGPAVRCRGERRPIRINRVVKKYEEGDRWVRETLGAVSLGFDPFEFLHLPDRKKRQWILAHSPESVGLDRTVLEALLFGRMVEALFGPGLAREQAICLGFDRDQASVENRNGLPLQNPLLPPFAKGGVMEMGGFAFGVSPEQAEKLKDRLTEVSRRLDRPLAERMDSAMERAFALWDVSLSAEENIAVVLEHLKRETLRLRNALRAGAPPGNAPERDGPALIALDDACSPSGSSPSATALRRPADAEAVRGKIRSLDREIGELAARAERSRLQAAQRDRREARTRSLRETMDALTRKLEEDHASALRGRIAELNASLEDIRPLREELDRLNGDLGECSADCRRREERLAALAEESRSQRGRVEALRVSRAEDFRCPLAGEIRCETDMGPYLGLLAGEIETLEACAEAERLSLESARAGLRRSATSASDARDRVAKLSRHNETVRREIASLREKLAAEEKESGRARGALKAYREEIESLTGEAPAGQTPGGNAAMTLRDRRNANPPGPLYKGEAPSASASAGGGVGPGGSLAEDIGELEEEIRRREEEKREMGEELARLLREQGRAEGLRELARAREELEKELKIAVLMAGLLGPDGIQGELAARVGSALEDEVNEVLRMIDPGYEFSLDLSGDRVSMGWNRDGKLVPLATINSAHFIFFIVPFLTALVGRLARAREKAGLPTLKALCIEAESMTPGNLAVLLRGLSVMKARGRLDNALVAHYVSLRDPEKLSGFKEHILSAPTRRGGRGGDDAGAIAETRIPPAPFTRGRRPPPPRAAELPGARL